MVPTQLRFRFESNRPHRLRCHHLKSQILYLTGFLLFFLPTAPGWCAPVDLDTARKVAKYKIEQHIDLYGDWNGATSPQIKDWQAIQHQNTTVAYQFSINPSGFILVAVDDEFSPIPMYSARSAFNPDRTNNPNAVESWIMPELQHHVQTLIRHRRSLSDNSKTLMTPDSAQRIARAWAKYSSSYKPENQHTLNIDRSTGRSATSGDILLTSQWGQGDPFNLQTPLDGTCQTYTGCVATAWAQVLWYYEWPDDQGGVGTFSYQWNGQTLSADFSDAKAYDWSNMPAILDSNSSSDEKNAVSWLMYYLGVAAQMDYGCAGSSSDVYANDVLDAFFKYKAMTKYNRNGTNATTWFNYFKTELLADRLVILSIFTAAPAGHEVVADGFQDDGGDTLVHINFGWPEDTVGWDGFYDITQDFNANGENWVANTQTIVIGITPNYDPLPEVTITSDAEQTVDEGDIITLSGSATPPDGLTITSYEWLKLTNTINSFSSSPTNATYTAPSVTSDTDFVFMLKATDSANSVGFATCTVTVRNTGSSSTPPPAPNSNSRGGGGCFMDTLLSGKAN